VDQLLTFSSRFYLSIISVVVYNRFHSVIKVVVVSVQLATTNWAGFSVLGDFSLVFTLSYTTYTHSMWSFRWSIPFLFPVSSVEMSASPS